ncbi:MAG: methyltransferase family protein [Candidatus Acidiferrales bacterium]
MKATEFEFRNRSLINLIHLWISFQVYSFDRVNVVWAFVPWNTPRGQFVARLIFGFGAILIGLAAAIRTWAAAYLRSEVVHDSDLHADNLVADGPYRHVRNPLYLGTFLLSVGLAFLASRIGAAILVVGAALRILRLIGREEADLGKQQGATYGEFGRRVPRLLPSLLARVPASGLAPQWGQAFRGEAPMWGFFIMMTAFAVTLNDDVAGTLAGATLLVWLFQRITERVRSRERA